MELKKYVPEENIVVDKISGKNFDRPGYQALKGALGLRSGDVLVVHSLDRLSRNKSDINSELKWFQENNIRLMVLDLPTTLVEVSDNQKWIIEMINNILIEVLASIAEQERLTIRKRQREGIDAAKAQGRKLGRKKIEIPNDWDLYYGKWKSGQITAKEMMDALGLKRGTFYRMVKTHKEMKGENLITENAEI